MNKLDMIISLAQPVRDEIKMGMFSTFQGTPKELEDSDEAYSLTCLGCVEDSHILYETEYGTPWITNITDEEAEYIKQHITDIPLTSDDVQQLWEISMGYDNCVPYVFTSSQREFIKKACEVAEHVYSSVDPGFYCLLDTGNLSVIDALSRGFCEFHWDDCNGETYKLDINDINVRKVLKDFDYKFIPIGLSQCYIKACFLYDLEYCIENVSKLINFSEDDYEVIHELFSALEYIFDHTIYPCLGDGPVQDAGSVEDWITEELEHSQSLSLDELKKSFEEQDWDILSY